MTCVEPRRARRAVRTLVACVAWLLTSVATTTANAADLSAILASAMDGTRTPALGAVMLEHGEVADLAVRGVRRNDRPDAVRVDDPWLIGSDAKPMTATLIARLVDQGRLDWNAPLAAMLPDLAAGMRPEYRSATLVQLLSHRAGLPHDVSDTAFFDRFYADARPLAEQRLDYVARALQDAPVSAPGTAFEYSNTGFLIAAVIAERTADLPYEELMRREVFDPLQMTTVGYGPTTGSQPIGHHDGRPVVASEGNPRMFAPAGNIHLSLGDWARFCIDQLAGAQGRGRLLSAASYRSMQTAAPGTTTGLAWGVQPAINGYAGPVLTHAGSDGNWYALVVLFPGSGNGALVVANAAEDMGGDVATKAALVAILAIIGRPAP